MKRRMTRTVLVTALLSAVAGAAITGYTLPRLEPAGDEKPAVKAASASASQPRVQYAQPAPVQQPSAKQPRSTEKSVLIVAGSAGSGAAIGALAGGKKGAAIGAIAGGTAGLIYDRHTANRK
jgi:hypothetical protein